MRAMRVGISGFLLTLFATAILLTLRTPAPNPVQAQEEQEEAENEFKAVRKELPLKCPCGRCDRDFLDCPMNCPAMDTILNKEREEIKEPVPMRLEVPADQFPEDKWIHGALITAIFVGTPAKNGRTKPGGRGNRVILERGDIITHINGEPVNTYKDYYELMSGAGAEKKLTVIEWNKKTVHYDYFRPVNGRIGIIFQPIRLKINKDNESNMVE